jgi:ubiquinone/menaquinone biosynthesis C-methylase UbiE
MPQKAQIEPGDYVDKTFSAYNAEQAASYAQHRSDPYTDRLYAIVLEHHLKSGGDMQTMLDVGCGTGEVTRSLGQHFDCAIGVDPSKEMIAQASKVGGQSKSGKPITFEVGRAECLNNLQSVGRAEVDLLVAGMAVSIYSYSLQRLLSHIIV